MAESHDTEVGLLLDTLFLVPSGERQIAMRIVRSFLDLAYQQGVEAQEVGTDA